MTGQTCILVRQLVAMPGTDGQGRQVAATVYVLT